MYIQNEKDFYTISKALDIPYESVFDELAHMQECNPFPCSEYDTESTTNLALPEFTIEIDEDQLLIIYNLIQNNRYALVDSHYNEVLYNYIIEKTSIISPFIFIHSNSTQTSHQPSEQNHSSTRKYIDHASKELFSISR